MKTPVKIILLILLLVGTVYLILDSITRSIVADKPKGTCEIEFSKSVEESKMNHGWERTYQCEKNTFRSIRVDDSLVIGEPFIERNWSCDLNGGLILVIPILHSTQNNLHRITSDYSYQSAYIFNDDKNNGVTFEMFDSPDTIELYIHERNRQDSLAWQTHTIVDTLILINN